MPEVAGLVLRPPSRGDEMIVSLAQEELAQEGFAFVFQDPDEPWAAYVAEVHREARGEGSAPDRVAATFLLAFVDGELVGRVSIRHELNPWLERFGGHIGYAVRPASRRRGIATAILRQALERARSIGLARALLVCDDANVGSIRTIEACGGVLERFSAGVDGQRTRRYWIVLGPGAASD